MPCPPEIEDVLVAMLRTGLSQIRLHAWQGEAELCGIEADHIHNLPDLLAAYTPDKLSYYWDVERPQYIGMLDEDRLREWEPLWNRLAERLKLEHAAAPQG
jgi:hypothetical protein